MLLKTRFYLPPQRANAVVRTPLLHELDKVAGGSLVVIAAPAGYGKTTLVSQWLHLRPRLFTWISLSSAHDNPSIFWHYVFVGLAQTYPALDGEIQRLLDLIEHEGADAAIIELLNLLDVASEGLSRDAATVLVLDDSHYLTDESVNASLDLFLDHLPSTLIVVTTSRDQPQWSSPRRRASGQSIELGAADLAFSREESECFLTNTLGIDQGAPSVTLEINLRVIDGWAAGLQMLGLSWRQHRPEQGANALTLDRHVSDYFMEEVLAAQPTNIRQFLLLSALPERFCAGLCNALIGASDSQSKLIELEQRDLFLVPLDNHRTWYRYHDLFRRCLQQWAQHLGFTPKHESVNAGVHWLLDNGYPDLAIQLLIDQQYWGELYHCMVDSDWSSVLQHSGRYEQWIMALPEAQQARYSLSRTPASNQTPRTDLASFELAADEQLTRRETRVLNLIVAGHSNKAIANELNISINTLKVHIRNLYGKLGVQDRAGVLAKIKP